MPNTLRKEFSREPVRATRAGADTETNSIKREFVKLMRARMLAQGTSKTALAAALGTSRPAVDRLLDPENDSLTLQTLMRAANAVKIDLAISIATKDTLRAAQTPQRSVARLNSHGDFYVPTTLTRGSDISSQRIDDLDRRAMAHLLTLKTKAVKCIELGSGLGWQSIRFAMMGASVSMYDLLPMPPLVATLADEPNVAIEYHEVDLSDSDAVALPGKVDIVFAQRFIHYLPYAGALELVKRVHAKMVTNGQFFISASGLGSELGNAYPHKNRSREKRFCELALPVQKKHHIQEPVCLYRENDLIELMHGAGFRKQIVWTSEFGNIKGIFEKAALGD